MHIILLTETEVGQEQKTTVSKGMCYVSMVPHLFVYSVMWLNSVVIIGTEKQY